MKVLGVNFFLKHSVDVEKQKHLSMAYTVGNKCAKNLSKRTILVQFIVEDVVACFFETPCT